jgi:CheY-like chemotaxis protein
MVTTTAPLVLLADDHSDSREMYAGYLSGNGFRVAEARDVISDAIQSFARHRFSY